MNKKGILELSIGAALMFAVSNNTAEAEIDFCSENTICAQVITCGVNNKGILRTFSTPCEAQCKGYQPVYYTFCKNESAACTADYKPVCGTALDGTRKTFGNRCIAKSSEARRIKKGACETDFNGRKSN